MLKLPYAEVPILTVHDPSREEFIELVQSAKEPFKVKDSMNDWLLLKELSRCHNPIEQCHYLESFALKQKVNFTILSPEQKSKIGFDKQLESNFSFKSKRVFFPEFIREVKQSILKESPNNLYLQSTPIKDLNYKLGHLKMFDGFEPITQPRFWIGARGQFVALHNDPFRNMIALFAGRKRVLLFPPEELPHLYPAPFDKRIGGAIASLVDVFEPDVRTFPLFEKALEQLKVAILEPGEFLYMPPLWWHAVEGEGFNVGLNCWFYDGYKKKDSDKLYLPAESLMRSLGCSNFNLSKKRNLYKIFDQILDVNATEVILTDKIDFLVEKEAKKNRKIIERSSINTNQKKLWRNWVKLFAFHYIFCLGNLPFDTVSKQEFFSMIQRYKKTRIPRIIKFILFTFIGASIYEFLMKKKRDKVIVKSGTRC